MKFWKKTSALLLSLMLVAPCAFFASCGEDDNDDTPSGEQIIYKQFSYDKTHPDAPGSAFNRYEGEEGYYEITLSKATDDEDFTYFSFAVSQAGQYALSTLEEKSGLTLERCDGSIAYISASYPATTLNDGTLYSYVHCPVKEYSSSWRATYRFKSTQDCTVKIRFERVGEALKEPKTITTSVTAKEIVGKAPNCPAEHAKVLIPWTTADAPTYFYDEDYEMTFTDLVTGEEKTAKGFYRYGTANNKNAPVIWVALTSVPPRFFGEDNDATFASILYKGSSLALQTGTAENGDILKNDYVDFIMNNGGKSEYPVDENGEPTSSNPVPVKGDDKMLCYMNVTNAEGLYPVNQELFEFLHYYAAQNTPILAEDNVKASNYWLAPCYYYEKQVLGSKVNPIALEAGENDVSASKHEVFYKVADATKKYTLVGSAGLIIEIGDVTYGADNNGFTVVLDAPVDGVVFNLKTRTAGDYTITISEYVEE
ncbi:MAG: hypothetical protein E7368_04805 [Clostridiales bacterium]|nr:hypothetical protein [Clostridiales bacterium]